mgnify:CR=1 FL=1
MRGLHAHVAVRGVCVGTAFLPPRLCHPHTPPSRCTPTPLTNRTRVCGVVCTTRLVLPWVVVVAARGALIVVVVVVVVVVVAAAVFTWSVLDVCVPVPLLACSLLPSLRCSTQVHGSHSWSGARDEPL